MSIGQPQLVMNTQSGAPTPQLNAYQQHAFRQKGIGLIKRLIEVVKRVQQHRAVNMAVLGGDHFFAEMAVSFQRDVEDGLEELRQQLETDPNLSQVCDLSDIAREWETIRKFWREYSLTENFELHCHLVRLVIDRIWEVANHTDHMLQKQTGNASLATYVYRELLEMAEHLGQLRGLSTHIAAANLTEDILVDRLGYLMTEFRQRYHATREAIHQLPEDLGNRLLRIIGSTLCYQKVDQMLDIIDNQLARTGGQSQPSEYYYNRCTEAINAVLLLIQTGIDLLNRELDENMQAWIEKRPTSS